MTDSDQRRRIRFSRRIRAIVDPLLRAGHSTPGALQF